MISMLLVVFLLFGGLSYFALTLNLVPQMDLGFVTIQTIYKGASPEEIESQVTKRLEDAVATVSMIDKIESYSMESVSFVIIQFELGKDPDIANQEVKDKVNAILNDLPDEADIPIVEKFEFGSHAIIDVILSGPVGPRELYDIADKTVSDRLAQVKGVARVTAAGGEEREIQVALDNRTVFQHALNLVQLNQVLAAWNMDMPGGNFAREGREYAVRVEGEFNTVEQLEKLEIPTAYGSKTLGSIADVRDTSAEVRKRSIFFEREKGIRQEDIVLLSIFKSSDGNTVEMAKGIHELLPELEASLPSGCRLSLARDSSIFIESSVRDTLSNIFLGILLTGLVLLFFLHDLRSTIIVSMAMPMSIISTFLLLDVSGFSLNLMSLMGLSTSVGILVVNSVVVLENIFRHKGLGEGRKSAAEKGTSEIALAVIASTMTNIVVFLPIAFMSSMIGQFFREFALTVTYATMFSLLISFTLTPMMASLILPETDRKKHRIGDILEKMFRHWEQTYKNLLRHLIGSRVRSSLVVVAAVGLFILSIFQVFPRVGFEFMPQLDEGDLNIEIELPQGTDLNETARLVERVEQRAVKYPEVKHIITTLGQFSELDIGPNLAKIAVKLVDSDLRQRSTMEVSNALIEDLSDIPNAVLRVASINSIGSGEAPVNLAVKGPEMDLLEYYKDQILERIRNVDGLINLNTSSRTGQPEILIHPDRKKLADAGFTVMDLGMTVRTALEGMVFTYFKDDGEEYNIRVLLEDTSVDSPEEIDNLTIVGPRGIFRLAQLADLELSTGSSKIIHDDKEKSIRITGHTSPGVPLGDIVNDINSLVADLDMEEGYHITWGGDAEMMAETATDMLRTFVIAVILTYMLLAAILESLTQPLMILLTVPLALIGAFGGLWVTGKTMNTISMMSIIMLLGIVVNNAILLLDYTNQLRRQGMGVTDALLEACPTKLKPILMSSIAIILGMMPMALGMGSAGREFRQPMAIVSIGGLVISTVLALIVIPAIYHLTSIRKKPKPETK